MDYQHRNSLGGGEIIRKNIIIAIATVLIAASIAIYFLVLRAPSFTISVSPSTLTIPRGGTDNITLSYHPNVPSNLSMSSNVSGPGSGVQFGEWIDPPFTFPVVISENAVPGTYTVTLEATDMDTGASATTTFTVVVIEASQPHQRLELSFFKGVWTPFGGEERALEQDVENMIADGVNIFAVPVLYNINSDGTVKLVLSAEWEGNEEEGYLSLIRKAHNAGLAVFLGIDAVYLQYGQLVLVPEEIRDIAMQNLTSACLHWADIAEQENVEAFSPINEPITVLDTEYAIKWSENILPLVKERFTGDVVIKFAGEGPGDISQYGSIEGYDYVAVDIYAIDISEDVFIEDYLKGTVIPYANGYVENYNLKGYIFGEMGVGADNEEQQAQIFQRFFEETWENTKGYFLCAWGPNIDPSDPLNCTFTDTPAENVIREWYTQT